MMKKIVCSSLISVFLVLSLVALAEAARTAKFPVVVKWDASGLYQATTDILLINLTGSPVTVDLDLYTEDGVRLTCGVMPAVTIPANGTRHISPAGCFAIAIGHPLDLDGIGVIKLITRGAPANALSIYWRIYDESVSPHELIDHGKETL
jgi:hypothetical protein